MRTIRQNIEEAIELLKTNTVQNHIKACHLVYLDLSAIKGFDPDPLALLAYYQAFLIEKHTSIKKVSFIEWAFLKIKAMKTKRRVKNLINRCSAKTFGDGDHLIQELIGLIRKAI